MVIRLAVNILAFAGLTAALVATWNYAYQPINPGHTVALNRPGPWLAASAETARVDLGNFGAAGGLHLRFSLQAENIKQGPLDWQLGRMHLEWVRDGDLLDRIPLAAAQGNELSVVTAMILTGIPPDANAELHIENLGVSGRLRLQHLEVRPVQSSIKARTATAITALAWLAWIASLAGPIGSTRSWATGLLWICAAHFLVIPGPWPQRSPIGESFPLKTTEAVNRELTSADFRPAPHLPGITESPNLLLRWKIQLRPLRPLLHGLLFLVPTLSFLISSGSQRRSLGLAAFLAIAVEAGQCAFGYGFGWLDVGDLMMNACGIYLGVVSFRIWKRHRTAPAQG